MIQIYVTVQCPECKGTGRGESQWDKPDLAAAFGQEWLCSKCFGKGTIKVKPKGDKDV